MRAVLLCVGKTDDSAVASLVLEYQDRLRRYVPFSLEILPDIRNTKNLTEAQQKQKEGERILSYLAPGDFLALLDERGRQFSSISFSVFLQQRMNQGLKRLVFVIGGPYGFSEAVYQRADTQISLSKMTFSHQMVRAFFVEQLYRGFTILRNEPYHHQ